MKHRLLASIAIVSSVALFAPEYEGHDVSSIPEHERPITAEEYRRQVEEMNQRKEEYRNETNEKIAEYKSLGINLKYKDADEVFKPQVDLLNKRRELGKSFELSARSRKVQEGTKVDQKKNVSVAKPSPEKSFESSNKDIQSAKTVTVEKGFLGKLSDKARELSNKLTGKDEATKAKVNKTIDKAASFKTSHPDTQDGNDKLLDKLFARASNREAIDLLKQRLPKKDQAAFERKVQSWQRAVKKYNEENQKYTESNFSNKLLVEAKKAQGNYLEKEGDLKKFFMTAKGYTA